MRAILLASLLAATCAVQSASAITIAGMSCFEQGQVFVSGNAICKPDGEGKTCQGANVFILTDGECHAEDGAGCNGIQVFVGSSGNCHGGPGENGCDGTRIITPGSAENCVAGDGSLLDWLLSQAWGMPRERSKTNQN